MNTVSVYLFVGVALASLPGERLVRAAVQSAAAEWPEWRGVSRDGVVTSFREPSVWPEQLTLQWKVDVGIGYVTPIVVGNCGAISSRREADEVMRALDADTGKIGLETRATRRRSSRERPRPRDENGP